MNDEVSQRPLLPSNLSLFLVPNYRCCAQWNDADMKTKEATVGILKIQIGNFFKFLHTIEKF